MKKKWCKRCKGLGKIYIDVGLWKTEKVMSTCPNCFGKGMKD